MTYEDGKAGKANAELMAMILDHEFDETRARKILDGIPDVDAPILGKHDWEETYLSMAVDEDNIRMARLLFEYGADPNATYPQRPFIDLQYINGTIPDSNVDDWAEYQKAEEKGMTTRLEIVKLFLEQGADPMLLEDDGEPLLDFANFSNMDDRGEQFYHRMKFCSLLEDAWEQERSKVVCIWESGCYTEKERGLWEALIKPEPDYEEARLWIDCGADINACVDPKRYYSRPLFSSIVADADIRYRKDVADFLIRNGFDVEKHGDAAWMYLLDSVSGQVILDVTKLFFQAGLPAKLTSKMTSLLEEKKSWGTIGEEDRGIYDTTIELLLTIYNVWLNNEEI